MGALDGKVAIVSGAGQGLGRAHALTLAGEGAAVVVNDVSGANASDVARAITDAGGRAAVNTDSVSNWDAAKALIDQAVETFGDFHILVNNAGVIRDKMSFSMEEDEFDSVIDVHLKGHFSLARHAAVLWRERAKKGDPAHPVPRRIINTTSEAALFGAAGQANYASAKCGIVSLTWVLARELGKYGVTSNAIAPRARTQMTENMGFMTAPTESEFDRFDPANVSQIVAWLASDAAADVNGQVFIVVGGDVHLVQPFKVVSSIHRDQAWDVASLAAAHDELLGGQRQGPPDMGLAPF